MIVIPGLTRNPVFSPLWIPAGVYPILDTEQE